VAIIVEEMLVLAEYSPDQKVIEVIKTTGTKDDLIGKNGITRCSDGPVSIGDEGDR